MYNRKCFIFSVIIFICFLGCTTNKNSSTKIQKERITLEYQQFIEEKGGFSLTIPKSWQITNMSISEYKVIKIIGEYGYNTIIFFSIDKSIEPVKILVDNLLDEWSILYGKDAKLIQRDIFITHKGLQGEKTIHTFYTQGVLLRQIFYYFKGENNESIVFGYSIPNEAETFNDYRFDNIIKSFEWTSENINKQEGRRFFEEKGKFSLIPPEPWESIDTPESKYKVIIIRDENGLVHTIMFTMMNYNDRFNLNTSVDIIIEDLNVRGNFKILQRSDFITLKNDKGEKLIADATSDNGEQYKNLIYFIQGNERNIASVIFISPIQSIGIFDEKFENTMKSFEWMD